MELLLTDHDARPATWMTGTWSRAHCSGCGTPREDGDRYCAGCGACLTDTIQAILDAEPSRVVYTHIQRYDPRTETAKQVRRTLRAMGIRGVRVTTPRYSMAQGLDIAFAGDDHTPDACGQWDSVYREHDRDCPRFWRWHLADQRIEALLIRAFPNLDNRSDSQTDYFDAYFHINSTC